MKRIFSVLILGLVFALNAMADEFDEEVSKPTFYWQYKSGKATNEVRMAQETARGDQEYKYRRIKWTVNGKFPRLAEIIQSDEKGTYRATFKITATGGALAENWQLILFTDAAYEDMLISIRDDKNRKAYGMKDNTCPKNANAIWTAHNTVTKETESYCLIPVGSIAQPSQKLPLPSGK